MADRNQRFAGQYHDGNAADYYGGEPYLQGHEVQGEEGYATPFSDPSGIHYMDNMDPENFPEIPDILLLHHFCTRAHGPRAMTDQAKDDADLSWGPVRDWLRTHRDSPDDVREAVQQRGEHAMTALHVACRNGPPLDVITAILTVARDTLEWKDSLGCVPLHYACSADLEVVKSLTGDYPDSKTAVDRQGRTPLHYALWNSNTENPISTAVIVLLSSTGAASIADDNGMLVRFFTAGFRPSRP